MTDPHRLSDYFAQEAQMMLSKYRQMERLLPNQRLSAKGNPISGADHVAEEGRFIESIIKNLLNKYLPQNLRALTGFILRPEASVGDNDFSRFQERIGDVHSGQIDILVYDVAQYPVFERFEDFAIVPPEGVMGIISIKKTLYEKHFAGELNALADATSLCRHQIRSAPHFDAPAAPKVWVKAPPTLLIAFGDEWGNKLTAQQKADKLLHTLVHKHQHLPHDGLISQISVLDSFSLLKGDGHWVQKSARQYYRTPYILYKHTDGEETYFDLPIQLLLRNILRYYYDPTRSPFVMKPGYERLSPFLFKVKNFTRSIDVPALRITKPLNTITYTQWRINRQRRLGLGR